MKRIILSFIVSGIALTCFSQQDDFLNLQLQKRKKENKIVINPLLLNPALQKKISTLQPALLENLNNLSHVLSNGDKVYLLSQDNMPCVVPDLSKFNMAGVYGRNEIPLSSDKAGRIPNLAIKQKAISR